MSRRRRVSRANHERWLVSYADFITLLFAFFVVLYSSSQVDKRKVGKLSAAIQVAFQQMGVLPESGGYNPGAPISNNALDVIEHAESQAALRRLAATAAGASENGDLSSLRQELEDALAAEIQRNEVAVSVGPDGLIVSLREIGFFDSGSANIRETSLSAFSRIAWLLLERPYRIRIEGHTDNRPIHNSQYRDNWELSTARATELVRLLILKYGFAPDRLSAAGYAQYHPVADNDTPDSRAQNRRVDLVILGKLSAKRTALPIVKGASQSGTGEATPTKPPATTEQPKPSPAIFPASLPTQR